MSLFKLSNGVYWQLEKGGLSYAWRNMLGGAHGFQDIDPQYETYFQTADIETIQTVDSARRILNFILYENLVSGWISPRGEFYSCYREKHIGLIEDVLGIAEWAAETAGWLKVWHGGWYGDLSRSRTQISEAQRRMLKRVGRDFNMPLYRDEDLTYEQAFPRGNKAMRMLIGKYESFIQEAEKKFKPIIPDKDRLHLYL